MIDPALLDDIRARLPVSEVVRRRVQLKKQGREWRGLSPFSKERTPSFYVNDQKRFWHDFSSGRHGDVFAFLVELDGLSFPEAVARCAELAGLTLPDGTQPAPALAPRRPEPQAAPIVDTSKTAEALALWQEAVHPAGTPVETYLTHRRIWNLLPAEAPGDGVRFHPSCKFGLRRVPAMLALVRNISSDEPQAIHRTALDSDGRKAVVDGQSRLSLGPVGGGAVKLTDDAAVSVMLGIGEGLESAVSLRSVPEFGCSPVWSVLSAGGIERFPALAGIETLFIAVDRDRSGTGQRAAQTCADRWIGAGKEVFRLLAKNDGADLNDIVGAA